MLDTAGSLDVSAWKEMSFQDWSCMNQSQTQYMDPNLEELMDEVMGEWRDAWELLRNTHLSIFNIPNVKGEYESSLHVVCLFTGEPVSGVLGCAGDKSFPYDI